MKFGGLQVALWIVSSEIAWQSNTACTVDKAPERLHVLDGLLVIGEELQGGAVI